MMPRLLVAGGLLAACAYAELRAGVAKVDITPPPGLPMWGYANRKEPAKGTRDPLYARVLVLDEGGTRLALVSVDLGRSFGARQLDGMRKQARERHGITHLLMTATHTHSAPAVWDEFASTPLPEWQQQVEAKIQHAVAEAAGKLEPARLGAGYGQADIAYNRRVLRTDGTVQMLWRNEEKAATEPVDTTVTVLRVDTAQGRPMAVLINYAAHPVVFGWENLEYSADFPSVTVEEVENAFGKDVLAVFLQGACGEVNPYYATIPEARDAPARRHWTGEVLGREAVRVAKRIETSTEYGGALRIAQETLRFKPRYSEGKDLRPHYDLPVSIVLIGDRMAWLTMPGEPFLYFQTQWRRRAPVQDTMFIGYTDGYFAYIPTIRAAVEGAYGGASGTYVEVGAGERMLDTGVIKAYELLGKLPGSPK